MDNADDAGNQGAETRENEAVAATEAPPQNKPGGAKKGNSASNATKGKTPRKRKTPDEELKTIVETLSLRINEFSQATIHVKKLSTQMKTLSEEVQELKRQNEDKNEEQPGPSQAKQPRESVEDSSDDEEGADEEEYESGSEPEPTENVDEEIDSYLVTEETPESTVTQDFDDLDTYFRSNDQLGDELSEQIANITNRALRGTKEKEEDDKLKALIKKHPRPKNIPNLQVPQVDFVLWNDLTRDVKAVDFQMQKTNATLNQALIPIVKGMAHLKKKDTGPAFECIQDAMKILCHHIKANIAGRRERLKKELQLKFKPLSKNEASATCLFGDAFQESVKKLDSTKTSLTNSGRRFLHGGRKGGHHKNKSQNWNQTWNQNWNQQGYKKWPQQRSASQKFEKKNNNQFKKKHFNANRK